MICRTCLKSNLAEFDAIHISDQIDTNGMLIQDMLEVFMPEMDLEISGQETVMCLSCVELLKNAYSFKKICFKTEETIYNYLYTFSVEIGQTVNLQQVLDYESYNTKSNDCKIEMIDLDSTDSSIKNVSNENIILLEELNKVIPNEAQNNPLSSKKRKQPDDLMETHPKQRVYSCDLCEVKVTRYSLLQSHKSSHTKQTETYKCEFCSYKSTRQSSLDYHMFIHKRQSKFQCELCMKFLKNNYHLKLHKRTHDSDLPHKCKECNKRFMIRSQLRLHIEENHLVKLLKCPECCTNNCKHCEFECAKCKATFSKKIYLEKHIAKH